MSARHVLLASSAETCSSLAGHLVAKDISPCLCHIAHRLLQVCIFFRAEEGHGQVASYLLYFLWGHMAKESTLKPFTYA